MRSTQNVSVKSAVAVDEDVLRDIERLMQAFVRKVVEALVAGDGLDPTIYRTVEDIEAEEARDRNFRPFGLKHSVEAVSSYGWSFRTKSGQVVSRATLDEILQQTNAGARRIEAVVLSNSSSTNSLSVRIDLHRNVPVSVEVSGEPDIVEEFARKARDVFEPTKPWWWPARTQWLPLGVAAAVLLFAHYMYVTLRDGPGFGDLEEPFSIYYMGAPLLFFAVCNPLTEMCWRVLMPSAQFHWRGGKERAKLLDRVRMALLGAPFAIVIAPWLQKHLGF